MNTNLPFVIITGGTQGLGRALSLEFGGQGCRVLAIYRSNESAAATFRTELLQRNIAGQVLRHDITLESLPLDSEIKPGEPIVLINNAASQFEPRPMHQWTWDDFQKSLDVAVKGSWMAFQSVLKPMLRAGTGTVINILSSTILDEHPPKGFAGYVTAKYAQLGFQRAISSEYGSRGLRVFSVSPGYMRTPLTESWDPRLQNAILAGIGGPPLDVSEVARQVRCLALDPATLGKGENYGLFQSQPNKAASLQMNW